RPRGPGHQPVGAAGLRPRGRQRAAGGRSGDGRGQRLPPASRQRSGRHVPARGPAGGPGGLARAVPDGGGGRSPVPAAGRCAADQRHDAGRGRDRTDRGGRVRGGARARRDRQRRDDPVLDGVPLRPSPGAAGLAAARAGPLAVAAVAAAGPARAVAAGGGGRLALPGVGPPAVGGAAPHDHRRGGDGAVPGPGPALLRAVHRGVRGAGGDHRVAPRPVRPPRPRGRSARPGARPGRHGRRPRPPLLAVVSWRTVVESVAVLLPAGLLAGYFVLAGCDVGLGMLAPYVARTPQERRRVVRAATPYFLGSEVWLVAAVG